MAGWHHWLNGREFEWTLGVGEGQGGLVCCNSWVTKSRTQLGDWTELNWKSLQVVTAVMKLKTLPPWKKSYDQPRQHTKKQRHYFANKGLSSQSCGFSISHVWMWELHYKESRALKNWCFWTEVLEKTLESPLDSKEIQPVYPKGNQSWIFIEGLMLKLKL